MHIRISWRILLAVLALMGLALGEGLDVIPGRYIVELSSEPVSVQVAQSKQRGRLRSSAAAAYRSKVKREQSVVRAALEKRQAVVLDSADTIANALFVDAPGETVESLSAIAGVKRVLPVRRLKMILDRAVSLQAVDQAWAEVGADKLGQGVKIAILDSGIDVAHPAFQDAELKAPDGFPQASSALNLTFTSGKIIVARSYASLLEYRDPDTTVRDRIGHGTALGSIAAGVENVGDLATIRGMAPKAYLGNYKVFGTPGYNDGTTDAAVIKAIDDAVADGMDIINLSLGYDFAPRLADDPEVEAVERATQAGVIVVVAAGNNGPGMNTISSPATAPSAIAVSASSTNRTYAGKVQAGELQPAVAVSGSGTIPSGPVSGMLQDVGSIDGNGLGCAAYPAGSLNGKIALIRRGDCTFEAKLTYAQRAGAVAAVISVADVATNPFIFVAGSATLPGVMISYVDGERLRSALKDNAELNTTITFTKDLVPTTPNRLTNFGAAGPNVDGGIKPDLLAVGENVYMATQSLDPYGDMYSTNGYITADGTSFSCPMVAGVAALLKSARPGLTVEQYRSLLVNTGTPVKPLLGELISVQQTGGGQLNALGAIKSTAAVAPSSLSFGVGGTTLDANKSVKLMNLGAETETFTVEAVSSNGTPAPTPGVTEVEAPAGGSVTVPVSFTLSGSTVAPHEGWVQFKGNTSGTVLRVPYWYAASNGTPAAINLMSLTATGRVGSYQSDVVLFRILDASGVALNTPAFEVSVLKGNGMVRRLRNYDSYAPGLFGVDVNLGYTAGTNTFRIQAGDTYVDFNVTGQ